MSNKKAIVTGAAGGVGTEVVNMLLNKQFDVIAIDNNFREKFFGKDGSVKNKLISLKDKCELHEIDIRDNKKIEDIFKLNKIDATYHLAAQPSHDWACKNPQLDFDINAKATLSILEMVRNYCPDSPFIFASTNKVYGDKPNMLSLIELEARYEYNDKHYLTGIDEQMSIDQSTHSVFGASKVAADIMVQEYGRYFNIPTVCFRAGCLTGSSHSGAELHGYLQYIVKCAYAKKHYNVYGYKGKQVRDQLDFSDLCSAFYEFYLNPRCGEVYNIGGGYKNSISILETIDYLHKQGLSLEYTKLENNRIGDHVVYYTNLSKFKNDYPKWKITKTVYNIIDNIINSLEVL